MTDPNTNADPNKFIITQHFYATSAAELTAILDHLAREVGPVEAAKFDVTREILPDGRHVAHVKPKTP